MKLEEGNENAVDFSFMDLCNNLVKSIQCIVVNVAVQPASNMND